MPGLRSIRFALRNGIRPLACMAMLAVVGCTSSSTEETIARDAFIQTYADLRIAALSTDSQRISTPDRDSVLTSHGVTAADLELFAEVHSQDVEYMREVWNDIELLLDREQEVVAPN